MQMGEAQSMPRQGWVRDLQHTAECYTALLFLGQGSGRVNQSHNSDSRLVGVVCHNQNRRTIWTQALAATSNQSQIQG